MGDPLTDPRSQPLLDLDTSEIDGLASFFGTVAGQAEQSHTALHGANGDETWTGAAADAFRTQLGKLPGDLSTVQESYGAVAGALRTYSTHVEPIQSQFATLYGQLQTASGNLTTAQSGLTTAKGQLTTATGAPKAKPTDPAVTAAHTAVTTAQGAVTRLQGEVGAMQTRGCHLLDEADTVRGICRSAISAAGGKAPQHHSSFWGSVCHFADDVGHFFAKAGAGIAQSFKNVFTGKDFVEFFEHPSWSTFGHMCGDLATVAGTLAAVAAPFAAPELLAADGTAEGADAAAEGAAGAAEGGADGAAGAGAGDGTAGETVSTFTKGATQVNRYAGQVGKYAGNSQIGSEVAQGHYKEAAIDAGFQHADIGGKAVDKLGYGEDAATEIKATYTSTKDYSDLRDLGVSDSAARRLAYGEDGEVPPSLRGAPTSDQVQSALAGQAAAYNRAATRALHVGQPLGHAIDTVGVDPAKDKVKELAGVSGGE